MRKSLVLLALLVFPTLSPAEDPASPRQALNFDAGWRFALGDQPGAAESGFADSGWRKLDVPHDWSIEGEFSEKHPTGGAGGFLPAGVGWYRKTFTLPESLAGRDVSIEFDGVMANSEVWINGKPLGKRPNGYVSFRYDLTGKLNFGPDKTNVLAVRADNSIQPASRWYTGAGIYRHVRLVVADPVHIEPLSLFVTTPKVSEREAVVRLTGTVANRTSSPAVLTVVSTVSGPDGKSAETARTEVVSVEPGKSADFSQEMVVKSPKLWDLDHPDLYKMTTTVASGGKILDEVTVPFGIREARFEADTGFWLNGKNFKLKGVCLHHEAGGLGAAVPLSVWERRLAALKELGVNAIRTSHNPVAPEFLDLCDRMGLLVMDEFFDCWVGGKNPGDYHLAFKEWAHTDLRDTIRRDRNHPSVILYSVGNEIRDTPNAKLAKEILGGLVGVCHANDPTRPVTQGLFRPNVSKDYENGLADMLDVIGQNYRVDELLAAHAAKPSRKITGTENIHDRKTWLAMRDNPPFAGQFLWTGIDYLGESRHWPVIGFASGLLDRTGFAKPMAFERQSWWSAKPMVHATRRVAPTDLMPTDPGYGQEEKFRQVLFSDWTPRDQAPHEENVEVYSNCDRVELLLNGKSLGAKDLPADASPRKWKVSFEPGTLEARGLQDGKVMATHQLRTAGKPAKVALDVDRDRLGSSWDDVAYVTATIVDEVGIPVPAASDVVSFELAGPGSIVAVDNADNASHEPFKATSRAAFQGRCVAVVRADASTGPLTVKVSAPGLAGSSLQIPTAPAAGATPGKASITPVNLPFDSATVAPAASWGFLDASGKAIMPQSGGFAGGAPFFFSAVLPEGNFQVTVVLGRPDVDSETTVKAELRRLMLEQVPAKAGDMVTRAFIVNTRTPRIATGGEVRLSGKRESVDEAVAWDDRLTLEFNGRNPSVQSVRIERADVPTVFLLGDSTVTDQGREPYASWGQMLTRFFKPDIAVANHAESGESLANSTRARRLDKVLSVMKPGDYVFIQFGHNDMKSKAPDALEKYGETLKSWVAKIRAAGGHPVLVTSVNRHTFKDGVVTNSLREYPEAVRQIAKQEGIPLIDLHAMTKVLYEALGPDESVKLFKGDPDGQFDHTHHSPYGAYEIAKCVIEGIRQHVPALSKHIASDVQRFDPAKPDPALAFKVPASPGPAGEKPLGD